MHKVLRRIAIHGGLTALFLAILGVAMAEIAAMFFLAPRGPAGDKTAGVDATAAEMRKAIPLTMAMWGFGIIAVLELARHFWNSRRQPVSAPPLPPPPPPPAR